MIRTRALALALGLVLTPLAASAQGGGTVTAGFGAEIDPCSNATTAIGSRL